MKAQRTIALLLTIIPALVAVIAVKTVGQQSEAPTIPAPKGGDVVRADVVLARQIVVTDEKGNRRIVLSVNEDGDGEIAFYDSDLAKLISIRTLKEGSNMVLLTKDALNRVALSSDFFGSGVVWAMNREGASAVLTGHDATESGKQEVSE